MKNDEIVKKLEEFNKFAEELFTLRFVDQLKDSGYKVDFKMNEALRTKYYGPDEEAIKAFINDIRRFIQKGDDTLKIHKLIPIYKSGLLNDLEKKKFNEVMSDLENFNREPSNIIINGENITNEKIWEVFLFGRFSHRSKQTKDTYDNWERSPIYDILKNRFITVLQNYLFFIDHIIFSNNQILKRLGSNDQTRNQN